MERRAFLMGLGGLTATSAAAQSGRPEVGFLHPGSAAALAVRLTAVTEGLRSRGFIDGQNVTVVSRFADFDPAKVKSYAVELVERRVSVILAVGPQSVFAVRALSTTVPIIAQDLESDPVKSGLVERLSHPGGNVTGLFFDFPDFSTRSRAARPAVGSRHGEGAARRGHGRRRKTQSQAGGSESGRTQRTG